MLKIINKKKIKMTRTEWLRIRRQGISGSDVKK